MRYLLDTHALIWMLYDSKQLSDDVKNTLSESECFVSIASMWEMAIKNSIGKLKLKQSIEDIADICNRNGISILDITPSNCDYIRDLPDIHHDPFDRIIIAQAKSNGCTIITKDSMISKYDVKTMW